MGLFSGVGKFLKKVNPFKKKEGGTAVGNFLRKITGGVKAPPAIGPMPDGSNLADDINQPEKKPFSLNLLSFLGLDKGIGINVNHSVDSGQVKAVSPFLLIGGAIALFLIFKKQKSNH